MDEQALARRAHGRSPFVTAVGFGTTILTLATSTIGAVRSSTIQIPWYAKHA